MSSAKWVLKRSRLPSQIEVADGHAHARLLLTVLVQGDAAFERIIVECAVVAVVKEEAGSGIAGDVDVGPAVVIEVGCHRGHGVTVCGFGEPEAVR